MELIKETVQEKAIVGTEKVIDKVTDTLVDKVVEKIDKDIPLENKNQNSSTKKDTVNFNIIDYKRDYSRSNIYADIVYRDNFRGDKELLARAGFIYYLK